MNQDGIATEDIPLKAVKFDSGKPQWELLSFIALHEVAKVMTHGATKYDAHNWRNGFRWTRPIGAALRQIAAFMWGEDKDKDSGLSHLAHAMCCLMFVLEHQMLSMGVDGRWTGPDVKK